MCFHPGWWLMMTEYCTCFHTLYEENLNTKTLWKQDYSLERQIDSSECLSDILERQEFNKYGYYNKKKCPQGVCSGEG